MTATKIRCGASTRHCWSVGLATAIDQAVRPQVPVAGTLFLRIRGALALRIAASTICHTTMCATR